MAPIEIQRVVNEPESRVTSSAGPAWREPPRSGAAELLLLAATALAFLDESIRKSLPGHPVTITALKDLLVLSSGLIVFFHLRQVPSRYLKYFCGWILVSLVSTAWVFSRYHSVPALLASIRTYTFSPLLFAAGYYLAWHDEARRKVFRIVLVGSMAAIAVGIVMEFRRDLLPPILAQRIFLEMHSGAGGLYIESIFASPQIFAQLMLVLAVWSFVAVTYPGFARRRAWSLALLLLGLYSIYISRIRTTVPLLGFALFFTWLVGAKLKPSPREGSAPARGAFLALALFVLAFTMYLLIFMDRPTDLPPGLARDSRFYLEIFSPSVVSTRLQLFVEEIRRVVEHEAVFGFGAGTGGPIRRFLSPMSAEIPSVLDTGFFLLFQEMGILGLMTFLICYAGLVVRPAIRIISGPYTSPLAIPSLAIAVSFLLWFLLKAHTVIANGFSHMLWMGSMGLCCAALDRTDAEQAFDPGGPDESPDEGG